MPLGFASATAVPGVRAAAAARVCHRRPPSMAVKRYVTEVGTGVDIRGGDYTKAAQRAVSDAIRHSMLNLFPHIGKSPDAMEIIVKIGAADPDKVDKEAVASELPYGSVTVETEQGGLNVQNENGNGFLVVVNAAVLVGFEE